MTAAPGAVDVSVVIPCYNEVKTVRALIDLVLAADFGALTREIIVVDDGSTDGTRAELSVIDDPAVRVILHERNMGKGSALKTGFAVAGGRAAIVQDADLEYFPEDIPLVVGPILRGNASACYGSRFRRAWRPTGMTLSRNAANRFLTLAVNVLYRAGISDACTCYKAFGRDVFTQFDLETNRMAVCQELTARTRRLGYRIAEVPIRYEGRDGARKSSWRDLHQSLAVMVKYRFVKLRRPAATRTPSGVGAPRVPGPEVDAPREKPDAI